MSENISACMSHVSMETVTVPLCLHFEFRHEIPKTSKQTQLLPVHCERTRCFAAACFIKQSGA